MAPKVSGRHQSMALRGLMPCKVASHASRHSSRDPTKRQTWKRESSQAPQTSQCGTTVTCSFLDLPLPPANPSCSKSPSQPTCRNHLGGEKKTKKTWQASFNTLVLTEKNNSPAKGHLRGDAFPSDSPHTKQFSRVEYLRNLPHPNANHKGADSQCTM